MENTLIVPLRQDTGGDIVRSMDFHDARTIRVKEAEDGADVNSVFGF